MNYKNRYIEQNLKNGTHTVHTSYNNLNYSKIN